MSTSSTETRRAAEAPGTDNRPSAPTFALSRPTYHVLAYGTSAQFDSVDTARAALAAGTHAQIVGALPFDPREPAALTAPARLHRMPHRLSSVQPALPPVEVTATEPEPSEHVRRIADAINVLSDHRTPLDKVVLARTVHLRAGDLIDPSDLLARLIAADRNSNGMLADLTPAGPSYRGHTLIGSSPEVLVRKAGSTVTCHPLAGSAPRLADPDADRDNGRMLVESAKDQYEHAFVVTAIAAALGPLCSRLDVPSTPTLTQTPDLWHLGTRIEGTVRDETTTALDLAVALHPTPAICGTPTAEASQYILATEADRGFYAGTVGWCESSGDGEWMVSIRCAELAADHRTLRASAGGGIVAGSDPELEYAETTTKLRTILTALGVGGEISGHRS
ncbi:isochorismate synthase [Williamsia sp.]|uniref:isochorismate synthase n=1 Tax=Williamsia sp. TaxID=1872085 RepID=UPI002F92BFD5